MKQVPSPKKFMMTGAQHRAEAKRLRETYPNDAEMLDLATAHEQVGQAIDRVIAEENARQVAQPSNDDLLRVFTEAARPKSTHLREQLAYGHMIALADSYEGWALDPRMSPEKTAMLMGWSDSMRALAEEVGPDWNPPEPERLTLIGFLGRKMVGE